MEDDSSTDNLQQNYNTFDEKPSSLNQAAPSEGVSPSPLPSQNNSLYWKLFNQNRLAVITLCYGYAAFGMSVSILGPVLLDLSCLTASSLGAISWLFFFQTFLFSGGSAFVGFVVTKAIVPEELILLVSMILLPISMVLVPFGNSITILAINLSVMGLILGCIENLCNIKMIGLFKDKVAPFLQALHFCYGFGAFLVPIIAKPFLSDQDCSLLLKNETKKFRVVHGVNYTVSVESISEAREMITVHYAFAIVAALMLPGVVLIIAYGVQIGSWQLSSFGISRKTSGDSSEQASLYKRKQSYEANYTSCNQVSSDHQSDSPNYFAFSSFGVKCSQTLAVVLLAGLVNLVYDGLQASFSDFGYTYAVSTVKYLEGRRSEAAYTESVFWGSFAFGRLLSIFFAAYFFPAVMIATQMVCLILIILFLLMIESFGSIHLLLFCFFIIGLCISSVVPSCLSLSAQYVVLTPTLTTGLIIGASIGEMLFPVLVGTLIDDVGPKSYVAFAFFAAVAAVFIFVALVFVGSRTPKFMTSGQTSLVSWKNCPADADADAINKIEGGGFYSRLQDDDN